MFLVRRVTNSFIFVWSALQPGGVYDQPGTFLLINKTVQTDIARVLAAEGGDQIKGCTELQCDMFFFLFVSHILPLV